MFVVSRKQVPEAGGHDARPRLARAGRLGRVALWRFAVGRDSLIAIMASPVSSPMSNTSANGRGESPVVS
jgi:hypothetical protein